MSSTGLPITILSPFCQEPKALQSVHAEKEFQIFASLITMISRSQMIALR